MRLMKSTHLFRNAAGKLLTVKPSNFIEPIPDVFMFEVAVESNQVFTLPTVNPLVSYVDLFLNLYTDKNGGSIGSNDNSGSNSQPLLSYACAANTEYYIKITGTLNNKEGFFGIQVTGPSNTGVPITEPDITSLTVGTPVNGFYLLYGGELWFKFKTVTRSEERRVGKECR